MFIGRPIGPNSLAILLNSSRCIDTVALSWQSFPGHLALLYSRWLSCS